MNLTTALKVFSDQYMIDRMLREVGFVCALLMVLLLAVGLCGNTVSFFIFTRPNFRTTSINVLLAALAVSDNVVLVLAVPVFGSDPLCHWLRRCPMDKVITAVLYVYPLTKMAQCCTIWLLMLITIERWIAVCRPLYARSHLVRRKALLSVLAVVSLSCFYNVVRFWEYKKGHEANSTTAVVIYAQLRRNANYVLWYENVLGALVMFIIPLGCLTLFNYAIARRIADSRKERSRLSRRQQSEHKTARMMLYIVLVFLICYGFSFVLDTLDLACSDFARSPFGQLLNNINNVLVIFNSTCNALFYWKYCSRFKKEVNILNFERYFHLMNVGRRSRCATDVPTRRQVADGCSPNSSVAGDSSQRRRQTLAAVYFNGADKCDPLLSSKRRQPGIRAYNSVIADEGSGAQMVSCERMPSDKHIHRHAAETNGHDCRTRSISMRTAPTPIKVAVHGGIELL